MWPFTKRTTISETRELGRRINDIIFELESVKKNIKDENTLRRVNELQDRLEDVMRNVKVKDYKNCSAILNMIEESVQDLNPLLTIAGDSAEIQITFINNLLNDYEKGSSNFLISSKYKDVYDRRRKSLSDYIDNLQIIRDYKSELNSMADRGKLANENGKIEESDYYNEKCQELKNLIGQQNSINTSIINKLKDVSIIFNTLVKQAESETNKHELNKRIGSIAKDSLEVADNSSYASNQIDEEISREYEEKQTAINERNNSQRTLSKSLNKVSSTSDFSRQSQKIKEERAINDSSDLKARQEKNRQEFEKYKKLAE